MKNAVVTGASRGIGLAVVQALAVDLSTPDGPARLIEYAEAELGGIDLLVNNAGGGGARPAGFLSVTDEDWRRTLDLTLFTTIRATWAALPGLLRARRPTSADPTW
ncbi:SDR family NAD(P)-dependent oxidoreductase [Amycolatopsis sp. H20-H5]|uniref:SDR family NAD(P)-dependent oxidoreductase n=1 Tax=Amycolatopsis sp. H20-H5 TaxID=3046309 RepID=UPI002DBE36EC|nr:SDR family NAD(P)-dependent oxidoreductase [Amycolatopsis sp. H20-H5]MEC3981920.1 SDR family NAD(P)-dependent oxidoreductase [Amycolatopsis sp. H20-H5]